MRIFILVAMASWTFLTGCSSAPSKEDRERAALHMRIGNGFLAQGRYPQAMSELAMAEKLSPKDPQILNNLGVAYYVRNRNDMAEKKFRAALAVAPDFSEAKTNLARVMIDTDRVRAAIELLHEVEGDLTYPNQEKTFAELGEAHFLQNQLQLAQDYLLRSLTIRRENCSASNLYGRVLQKAERWPQAAQALDQAVEFCRSAKFEEPLFYSAMSYYSMGDQEKTRARLQELLKDYPRSKFVAKAKGMLGLLER